MLEGKRPETREGEYIGDLALHAAEFADDLRTVEQRGGGFPCVRRSDGTTAPIDIGHVPSLMPFRPERVLNVQENLVFVGLSEARHYLKVGMVTFLTSRLRSLREALDRPVERVLLSLPSHNYRLGTPQTIKASGFTVTVSASPGLRVHVSPTFRRSWRFFAAFTDPVTGTLPGGIYEFAVDGGAYASLTPDTGTFDIPYTTTTPDLTL